MLFWWHNDEALCKLFRSCWLFSLYIYASYFCFLSLQFLILNSFVTEQQEAMVKEEQTVLAEARKSAAAAARDEILLKHDQQAIVMQILALNKEPTVPVQQVTWLFKKWLTSSLLDWSHRMMSYSCPSASLLHLRVVNFRTHIEIKYFNCLNSYHHSPHCRWLTWSCN